MAKSFELDTEARMGKTGKRGYVQVLRLPETICPIHLQEAIRQALDPGGALGDDAVRPFVLCRA
ncbi:MAG: hypothetical protein Q4P24_15185 [Rhodobacterales bacterium]|nr:hypothetical protein [Rhodobacterales bacterium]